MKTPLTVLLAVLAFVLAGCSCDLRYSTGDASVRIRVKYTPPTADRVVSEPAGALLAQQE